MIIRVLKSMGERVETIRMLSDNDKMIMFFEQEYIKMRKNLLEFDWYQSRIQ